MSEQSDKPLQIVCLASYFKGVDFLSECKQQGARVVLITKEKNANEEWPRESLDDFVAVPDDVTTEQYVEIVSQFGRQRRIDRLVALEEFDVINAGLMREHLRIEGMTVTLARIFRDKLTMRIRAGEAGVNVPEFVHALNYNDVGEFVNRVEPPWVLKPRSDVSAVGIKKLDEAEHVWRAIEELDARERLRERSGYWLLERFVPGEVYHVDSLINGGRVIFAGANRYGRPPMDVAHKGGVFLSYTVARGSREERELLRLNQKLVKTLGLERGAAHTEFIKSEEDGRFYFLEIAARVGGAFLAETLEAASGINLWREWAKVELAGSEGSYVLPDERKDYGGIALSLARQEEPDTSRYTDAEIFYRVRKQHHVGLVVGSKDQQRVRDLLDDYTRRFAEDFIAVVPPRERIE
ncbi:MAG TPA: ATP-grasp domain-containing protein [Pyrinomonadaceae bacterium]|nr:ATP-grasp domain-containing protein [Pyrinomonadaceae bacterium]